MLYLNFSWERLIFSKIFMELLMEKKEKIMDNYLFNLKFIVSKTGLKTLCHVASISTIQFITDMICTVACQETEVVRFLGSFHLCLFLNYFNQTTKSNLSKNYYQIWSPKQKTNFLQPRYIFSLLITSFREVLIQAQK